MRIEEIFDILIDINDNMLSGHFAIFINMKSMPLPFEICEPPFITIVRGICVYTSFSTVLQMQLFTQN